MNRIDVVWGIGRWTIQPLTKLSTPLRNYGVERIPPEGGVVLAMNHFSWLDPPAFGSCCPRTIHFLAKSEIHRHFGLGQLIRAFGTRSVRRGESDREAVRAMREIVRDGHALGLFVEGTRQKNGMPGEAMPGAAMVALQEDVPVVHETPGVTRDRKEVVCEWAGRRFLLVDTGGVDVADPSPLTQQVAQQARRAIAEADLVLFVLDTRAGITPGDEELAAILRHSRKPIFLIANKIDEPGREAEAFEFHRLGLGDPIPVSSVHGHGTGDLLDAIVARLPGSGPAEAGEAAIRVAILGRPNVGKSSLLNALLGEERVIVSEQPGTTRDSIDTVLARGSRTFVLVDTAGIRRKRRQRQGIEYYSELRALQAAERADVALVLVDSSDGVVEQDLSIADIARKSMSSTLVVLSKWDVAEVGIEDVRERLEPRLRQRPPILAASAKTKRGVGKVLDRGEELYDKYTGRGPTCEL